MELAPWGKGRPGWHTECAAMVHRYLGTPIDIHGGGSDLAFPHHENECAQATCAWHEGFANTWMHTGMLLVDGEKMSKSLGNFFTLEEVLEKHSAAALRLLMLQTHYRSPLDFSWERLEGAENSLARIAGTVNNLVWAARHSEDEPDAELAAKLNAAVDDAKAEFEAQMDDDFNTAGAVAAYFQLVTEANTYLDQAGSAADKDAAIGAAASIAGAFKVLGIELPEPEEELPVGLLGVAAGLCAYTGDDVNEAAERILAARAEARAAKDWGTADAIRDPAARHGSRHRGYRRRLPHQTPLTSRAPRLAPQSSVAARKACSLLFRGDLGHLGRQSFLRHAILPLKPAGMALRPMPLAFTATSRTSENRGLGEITLEVFSSEATSRFSASAERRLLFATAVAKFLRVVSGEIASGVFSPNGLWGFRRETWGIGAGPLSPIYC